MLASGSPECFFMRMAALFSFWRGMMMRLTIYLPRYALILATEAPWSCSSETLSNDVFPIGQWAIPTSELRASKASPASVTLQMSLFLRPLCRQSHIKRSSFLTSFDETWEFDSLPSEGSHIRLGCQAACSIHAVGRDHPGQAIIHLRLHSAMCRPEDVPVSDIFPFH
jgi:hypothetical protein